MRRVNSQSKCNSKCCCCGCLDNLRICLLADGSTCPCRPLRGGLPSLPLANPAFSLLPCPLSPSPFPNGEGEIYGYFMQGASPLASPAFNRLRHLQSLPYRYPHGVAGFFNPDSRRPGGCQRSIQRRKNRFSTSKTSAASRPALGDARGEAPCIRKQKISPFPPGKSALRARAGGLSFPFGEGGQQSKLKAGVAGDKKGKPPRRVLQRQGQPAPQGASPAGLWFAQARKSPGACILAGAGAYMEEAEASYFIVTVPSAILYTPGQLTRLPQETVRRAVASTVTLLGA